MSQVTINVESNEITSRVFGCFDCNIKAIERAFDVRISNRRAVDGDAIVIDGHEGEVALADVTGVIPYSGDPENIGVYQISLNLTIKLR